MKEWLKIQWSILQAYRLDRQQQQKLREHEEKVRIETAAFLDKLGDTMSSGMPTRCAYVYEMVLDWSQGDSIKIKQAALYLFLWEVEQKKEAAAWEVEDIAFDIEHAIQQD